MKSLFKLLLPINSITLLGLVLIIIGFLLLPFLIGFPLMIIGILILVLGVLGYFLNLIPKGRLINKYLKDLIFKLKSLKKIKEV